MLIKGDRWEETKQLLGASLPSIDKHGVFLCSNSVQNGTLTSYLVTFSHLPTGSFTAGAPLATVYLHKWLLIKSLETDAKSLRELTARLTDLGCEVIWWEDICSYCADLWWKKFHGSFWFCFCFVNIFVLTFSSGIYWTSFGLYMFRICCFRVNYIGCDIAIREYIT